MGKLSVGQKKFLASFLSGLSLAWLVGTVITPFFAGKLFYQSFLPTFLVGVINAVWTFSVGLSVLKGVRS